MNYHFFLSKSYYKTAVSLMLISLLSVSWLQGKSYSSYLIASASSDNKAAQETSAFLTSARSLSTKPVETEAPFHSRQIYSPSKAPVSLSPSVNLINPINEATFIAPANITPTATATDANNPISKVEFFAGSLLIGVASTPNTGTTDTYSVTWSNVVEGSYLLSAVATNNLGQETSSNSVWINVNPPNAAPTVSLTYPANNATFAVGSNIAISANAEDFNGAITKVEFFHSGNVKIGEATSAPFNVTWENVLSGTYNLTAIATDDSNSTATSTTRTITIAADTPTIVSLSPSSGIAGTTVTIDGANFGSTQTTSNVTFNGVEASLAPSQEFSAITSLATPADFDGDGQTDIAVFRPSNSSWLIINSSDGSTREVNFGLNTDKLVPADYDGDGKADIAVMRPSTGAWYILKSSDGALTSGYWGGGSDVPVPADYDGDGKADLAVWRPSEGNWYILNSSDNSIRAQQFGLSTDRLVPADYDEDGKADVAVFRSSSGTWYINKSSDNSLMSVNWGLGSDITAPGDYDGDGKADIAVWRPSNGTWYIRNSADETLTYYHWGLSSDKVVPGDYDGDSKMDYAFWRTSSLNWNIINSSNNSFRVQTFGQANDLPVSSIVTYDSNQQPASTNWSSTRLVIVVPHGATTGPVKVTVNGVASNSLNFSVILFIDSDSDGLSDEWELQHFGTLNQGGNDDFDGDGVSNLDEYLQGRNPTAGVVIGSTELIDLRLFTPFEP